MAGVAPVLHRSAEVHESAFVRAARNLRCERYENRPTYDLAMGVSDGKDRVGNSDPSIDSVVALKLNLEDVPTRLSLAADSQRVKVGKPLILTATYQDLPADADLSTLRYTWKQLDLETLVYYPDVAPRPLEAIASSSTMRARGGSTCC